MEDDKRLCIQHSPSLPPPSSSSSISSKTREVNDLENAFINAGPGSGENEKDKEVLLHEDCGRERLKRHRVEVAGRVWIPDMWGQEDLLKDWIDCSAFDAALVSNKIMSARSALMGEGRRASSSTGLRIGNGC